MIQGVIQGVIRPVHWPCARPPASATRNHLETRLAGLSIYICILYGSSGLSGLSEYFRVIRIIMITRVIRVVRVIRATTGVFTVIILGWKR